jgi:hypothetical protein
MNTIPVELKTEQPHVYTGVYQHDYGQILQIHGKNLPAVAEVQFSLQDQGGQTETRVGVTTNDVLEVQVPDKMLKNEGVTENYCIFAYLYITDGKSGNTEYKITIHATSRPAPGEVGEDPEEKRILDEAVEMVNQAADRAEAAERGASDQAAAAEQSKTDAAESAETAKKYLAETEEVKEETVKELTELSESVKTVIADGKESIAEKQAASEKAITDHTDAEIGRQNAATKEATDGLTGQITKAETADNELKTTVEDAGKKKAELVASIHAADTAKGRVDNSTELAETAKKNLDKSVQDASDQKTELDKTVTRAEELDTSLGEKIETSKQLKTDLQTAGEKATQDIHTAGEEERSQMTQIAEQFQESIDALTPDDSVVDGKAWTSKKIIDTLCPEFQETGNPVTCYPVAGYPLDVTVSWEPVQPGSGDPYPGGGGKNLLDISRCVASENEPYGLHVTIDKDVIKIDGVPNGEVVNEGEYQFAVAYATQTELQGKGYKVTAFAEKGIVYRAWGLRTADEPQLAISARLTPGVNTDIQVRLMVSKSESTVYYPYENIRPIHGRDNVTIKRCGENVLKTDGAEEHNKVMNGITYERLENGGIHLYGTTTDRTYYHLAKTYMKIYKPIPAGEYTFCPYCELPDGVKIYFVVNGIVTGSFFSISPDDKVEYTTRRISNAVETIDAYIFINEAGKTVDTVIYPMLAVGNIPPSTYAMYTEQCICAELSEETSYGGTLNTITGIGTADWTVRTFDGTETWNSWGVDNRTEGITGFYSYDVDDYDYAYTSNAFSSHTISNPDSWGGGSIGFGFANENSTRYFFVSVYNELLDNTESNEKAVESWKAYLAEQYAAGTPVQIAYKLAEPIPFQIEGEQILALKGINNILTDADTVTVTGREDPVHYVGKKFAELSAAIVSSASEAE